MSVPSIATASRQNVQPSHQPITRAFMALLLGAVLLLAQMAQAGARGAPESFADLAEKVSPAVVNITTATMVAAPTNSVPGFPNGSPFEDFFREFLNPEGEDGDGGPNEDGNGSENGNGNENAPKNRRSQALGSGFVISEDGYIVTNNHVIEGADEITIEFFEGGELKAKLIGTDPKTDIALLKVESDKPLKFVAFGDSDIARVGDWVMAMGNPLGQGFSVSAGIVSARNRALSGTYDDYIQTDAAINRGNSGGPLFNMDGAVIGVNTAILSPNGGSIGIGFAMSASVVTKVVAQLKEFGETRRGWLGVRIQDVTEDVAEAMGLEKAAGALVTDVPEGPAADAGIEGGDLIQTFDGRDVEDVRGLVRQVGNTEVGKAVRVVVLRDGKTQTLLVTLARREDAEAGATPVAEEAPEEAPAEQELMGLTLLPMSDELREQLGLSGSVNGLVVTGVDEASEAFEKGLRAGDVITEAGQQKVNAVEALEARVKDTIEAGRKSLLLLINRSGDPRFVALSVE